MKQTRKNRQKSAKKISTEELRNVSGGNKRRRDIPSPKYEEKIEVPLPPIKKIN